MSKAECMDCAALPKRPERVDLDDLLGRLADSFGVAYRPATWRKIDPRSTPRRPRCATHWRAADAARRQAASDKRSRTRSGVDEPTRQLVLAEQSHACAGCARRPGGKRLNLDADHDHDLAATHDHPAATACRDCLRGYLCRSCNRDIVGMLRGRMGSDDEVATVLRNLVGYLTDPPARRLRSTT